MKLITVTPTEIVEEPVQIVSEDNSLYDELFAPFEDGFDYSVPATQEEQIMEPIFETSELSAIELINMGIDKLVNEKINNSPNLILRSASAKSLEFFIKHGLNKDMQRQIINTAVHIRCNQGNSTEGEIFKKLYNNFGNSIGRNFANIRDSFTNENKSILDVIVNELNLGIHLIEYYYNYINSEDIRWAISDCLHCYHNANLVNLYLNCILNTSIEYNEK